MSEFPPPPPPPASATADATGAGAAAGLPPSPFPEFTAVQWALAQRFMMEQMRAAAAAQAQPGGAGAAGGGGGGAAAPFSLMMPPASASAAATGSAAPLPLLPLVGSMSAPAAGIHSQIRPAPAAAAAPVHSLPPPPLPTRPKSGPGSRGGKVRAPADLNKPKKPRASSTKKSGAAAASAVHDDTMPALVPFAAGGVGAFAGADSSSDAGSEFGARKRGGGGGGVAGAVRGRPRGRPRSSGLPAGETRYSASVAANATAASSSATAAAAASPQTDGSVRIGGLLYVPSTFVVVGPKHNPSAQRSALEIGRRVVRSLARRGGSLATLPSVDYSEAFLPTAAAANSSPASPAARQGTKRKGARTSTNIAAYQEWGSEDEDAFMGAAAGDDDEGGKGTAKKAARPPRASKDPSGAKSRKSAAKSAADGSAASRSLEAQWQPELVPEFDPSLPRSCMFNFARDTRLPMDVLPAAYRSPTFVEIMEAIKTWTTGRLHMNHPSLAVEMGCSNSTIYFLITNTYKYDLANFNIRVRHYLWRNDQWMVGRVKQILSVRGTPQEEAAAASAAQVTAAAMQASAAAGGTQAMETEESPAAAAASAASSIPPTAVSAAAAPSSSAAVVPPIPAELLALDPPVSPADWRAWLDCTLAVSSRPRIDDVLWPRVQAVEAEVKARWDEQQRRVAAAKAAAEREQMIALGIITPEEAALAEATVAAAEAAAAAAAANELAGGPRSKRPRKQKLAARLDPADFAADDDYEMMLMGAWKPATERAGKTKVKKERSKKGENGDDDEEFTAAAAAAAGESSASSASDVASSSDSDRGASGNESDSGDEGGKGAKRARGKAGRKPRVRFEGASCNYPLSRSSKTNVRHSAQLASPVFKQPRWNFGGEGDGAALPSPLVAVDVHQILLAHLPAALKDPATIKLLSNGVAFELPVLSAASNNPPAIAAAAATAGIPGSPSVLGGNALINVGAAMSAMAWAPLGDATHSPLESTQYLAVALHWPNQYIRLSSSETSSNLILVYACSLMDASTAPRLALVLTHTHGSCLSLRFYPHSLETFGGSVERMGVLAAVFNDGAFELRAIPKPTLHAQHPQQPLLVDSAVLSALPGFALSFAPGCAATCVAFSPAPSSSLVAVGASDGSIRVLDLEESESDLSLGAAGSAASACLTIHVRVNPSSLVSSLVFHPLLPHLLAACCVDGRVLLWDLRRPEVELLQAVHTLEICRSIHWPAVSHTSLEMLVVSQGSGVRIIPLQKTSPLLSDGGKNTELSACASLPLPASTIIVDLAAADRNHPSEPWLLVGANSDGTLFGYKENLDQQPRYAHSTKGLSVTRWTARPAGGAAAAGAGGEQKQADPAAVVSAAAVAAAVVSQPGSLSSSPVEYVLEVSDSFPRQDTTQKSHVAPVRASRLTPDALRAYSNPFPPHLVARDTATPLTSVAINPNLAFPHVVAAGGLAGIVRMQTVRDL